MWNDSPLGLRFERKNDRLQTAESVDGGKWSDDDADGVYYQNLPTFLKSKFPMLGTQECNNGDNNILSIPMNIDFCISRSERTTER